MSKLLKVKSHKQSGLLFYTLLLIIPCLQFVIFWISVNINSILMAFKDYDKFTGNFSWVGFSNFTAVIRDLSESGGVLNIAIKNSLIVYSITTFIEMPLTIFFAYYIFKKMPRSEFFRVILFIPGIISTVVLVQMYMKLADSGVKEFLNWIKGVDDSVGLLSKPSTTFPTVVFYHIWISFGSILLILSSGMSSIDPSITEACSIDGASRMQELFKIVLPQIFPTLATYLTVGVVGIFVDQANLYTFFRDGASVTNYTIGYYLFIKVMGSQSSIANYPEAAAMGLTFTFVAIPITFSIKYILERLDPNN